MTVDTSPQLKRFVLRQLFHQGVRLGAIFLLNPHQHSTAISKQLLDQVVAFSTPDGRSGHKSEATSCNRHLTVNSDDLAISERLDLVQAAQRIRDVFFYLFT